MAITYTWDIINLSREISDGGVYRAQWRCTGVDENGNRANKTNSCEFTYDASASGFIPYADITLDKALGWVWGKISKSEIENAVATLQPLASTTSSKGVPWAVEEKSEESQKKNNYLE